MNHPPGTRASFTLPNNFFSPSSPWFRCTHLVTDRHMMVSKLWGVCWLAAKSSQVNHTFAKARTVAAAALRWAAGRSPSSAEELCLVRRWCKLEASVRCLERALKHTDCICGLACLVLIVSDKINRRSFLQITAFVQSLPACWTMKA